MNETTMHITGNLVDAPELRYTPAGVAVSNFRIASTTRIKDGDGWKDGDTIFMTVNCWRDLGGNVAESLVKGTRVMVTGRLKQRQYQTREGENRTVFEIDAYDVGVSLWRATAKPVKADRDHELDNPAYRTARRTDVGPETAAEMAGRQDASDTPF